jgi:hypothetical protein
MSGHRIFTGCVDDDHDHVEVLVQVWEDDEATVAELAFRSHSGDTWGSPIVLIEAES